MAWSIGEDGDKRKERKSKDSSKTDRDETVANEEMSELVRLLGW